MCKIKCVRSFLTKHGEISSSECEVPGARCCRPAHVYARVLPLNVRDEQVAVAEHFGVIDVDGLVVGAAPRDERPRIPDRHALQEGAAVSCHGEVAWPGDDVRPLGDSGRRRWTGTS